MEKSHKVEREKQITCFTIKTPNVLGGGGNFLNQIKVIHEKCRANITCSGERLKISLQSP